MSLIAWLPFRLRMAAGGLLGRATWLLARERRYITEVNIRLCFPELDAREQAGLVYQSFIENGKGLIETATGWVRPARHFLSMVDNRSYPVLAKALAEGRGVLLLGAHYSTLDFSANLLSLHHPFAVTYRAHKNPLFDAFMLRGRLRNCNGVFDRRDIRGAFRHLRDGKILWYAPDQDYGPEKAVYAPFFGQQAATITAGSRFAAFNKSPALIVSHRRVDREKKYILEALEVPAEFPSGDDQRDAALLNELLENEIRKAPAQYLWMHKRFKTQPGGKPDSPYIFIATRTRRLNPSRYKELIQTATPLATDSPRMTLPDGRELWFYEGLARGLRRQRHPALQLDSLGKQLRHVGVRSVIVDSLFRVAHLQQTVALVYLPAGLPLTKAELLANGEPLAKEEPLAKKEPLAREAGLAASAPCSPAAAADFLLRLHGGGLHFHAAVVASQLLWDGQSLALLDPLALDQVPGTSACVARLADLNALTTALTFDAVARQALLAAYLARCRPADRALLEQMLHTATLAS